MLDKIEALNGIINRTNGKLRTIMQLLEQGEMTIANGKLITSDSIEIRTVYSNHSSVSIGHFPKCGDKMNPHEHSNVAEYLICVKGKAQIHYDAHIKELNYKDCIYVPQNTIHSVEALEDDTEVIAVCVPAEEGYKKELLWETK